MSEMDTPSPKEKLFNDCVHGHFTLPSLCVAIIDTPIFQRLRYIKQLGLAYYVFPSACHNRFEHCLGVSHLAGEMADILNNNDLEPEIQITPTEKLCLQVAGLCHDLGHGPFSHTWEKFIHTFADESWKHEEQSISLFDLILEDETVKTKFESCGLGEQQKTFIKSLILGVKDEESDRDFIFEIICNNETGIDVDKWDYLLRDGKQLNINILFDSNRLRRCLRVMKVQGKYHICYRNKEKQNIFYMYMARAELFRTAYHHPVVTMIEQMWIDALKSANDNDYLFKGKKLSDVHKHPIIFSSFTDSLLQDLIQSEDGRYEEAQKLLKRIQGRRLYKVFHRICLPSLEDFLEIRSAIEKKKENKDIHVCKVELKMPVLAEHVFLYGKDNLNAPAKDVDWSSVPVFPSDVRKMKRIELFFFCKENSSRENLEHLCEFVKEIISEHLSRQE